MLDQNQDGPTNDEGPVSGLPDGVTRRQTLQGMAWAAPAIMIATAVPAATASGTIQLIPADQGAQVQSLDARYWESYWVGPRPAVVMGMYMQNAGNDVPATATVTLTVQAPVTGDDHAWGIGGSEGIPSGEPWTLASYSRTDSMATLVLVYTGGSWGQWGGASLSNLWFATADELKDARNKIATATINATYQAGASSIRSTTDKVKASK